MSGSTRIKGVALALKFGSPAVDYWCDVTAATITNDEGDTDVITFCDAAEGGGRQYFLNMTAIQSTDADGLWRYTWEHSGEVVGFTYAPHGNELPTVEQPHFIGTVKIGPRPTIGGEAGTANTFTFETVWEIEGVPTLDDGVVTP